MPGKLGLRPGLNREDNTAGWRNDNYASAAGAETAVIIKKREQLREKRRFN
jgi:hypothetical protein